MLPAHHPLAHTRPVRCPRLERGPGLPPLGHRFLSQIPGMPSVPAAGQALGPTPCGCLLAAAADKSAKQLLSVNSSYLSILRGVILSVLINPDCASAHQRFRPMLLSVQREHTTHRGHPTAPRRSCLHPGPLHPQRQGLGWVGRVPTAPGASPKFYRGGRKTPKTVGGSPAPSSRTFFKRAEANFSNTF